MADAARSLDVLLSRLLLFLVHVFSLPIHCRPFSVSFLTLLEESKQDGDGGAKGAGGAEGAGGT